MRTNYYASRLNPRRFEGSRSLVEVVKTVRTSLWYKKKFNSVKIIALNFIYTLLNLILSKWYLVGFGRVKMVTLWNVFVWVEVDTGTTGVGVKGPPFRDLVPEGAECTVDPGVCGVLEMSLPLLVVQTTYHSECVLNTIIIIYQSKVLILQT